MIVKAISHTSSKKSSMQKLINYVFNPDKIKDVYQGRKELIIKNLVRGYDKDSWGSAFYQNDQNKTFTHSRRTVLRHEIVSFAPESNQYLSRATLQKIAKYYLANRSPKSLCVGAVHYDESPHIHFIISGVGIDGKSTRISRTEFKQFKIKLQEFQQSKFPELSASIVEHDRKKKV
jgi:hypothetical protein